MATTPTSIKSKCKMIKKDFIYSIDQNILKIIRKYLTVKDTEKNLFGEVFTHVEIVCEMLDKLPEHLWSDPSLKWLDPANGIGNYPLVTYYKLMESLKDVKGYENKGSRSKHIIENMLFMVELNPINCRVCKKIFRMIDPNAKPNIYNKDFFKWNGNYDKYDIIMGNPPYNEGGTGRGSGSRQPLWPKFIDKSLEILSLKGYLVFIHPTGWRKPYYTDGRINIGRVLSLFLEKGSLYYINLNDRQIKNFPAVDYYIFYNDKLKTTMIDSYFNNISKEKFQLDINTFVKTTKILFLPSLINDETISIFTKIFRRYNANENYDFKYDGTLDCNKKMLNNPKVGIPFAFYFKNNKYVEVYKKEINHKVKDYYKNPKIVCTFNGSNPIGKLNPIFYKTPIATTTYTMYQIVKNTNDKNIKKHINFLNSKLLLAIMKLTQYSPVPRNKNDHKILNLIQIPNLPDNPTDKDIYNYYKLTKEERDMIEKIVLEKNISKTKNTKKKKLKLRVIKKSYTKTKVGKVKTKKVNNPGVKTKKTRLVII